MPMQNSHIHAPRPVLVVQAYCPREQLPHFTYPLVAGEPSLFLAYRPTILAIVLSANAGHCTMLAQAL